MLFWILCFCALVTLRGGLPCLSLAFGFTQLLLMVGELHRLDMLCSSFFLLQGWRPTYLGHAVLELCSASGLAPKISWTCRVGTFVLLQGHVVWGLPCSAALWLKASLELVVG